MKNALFLLIFSCLSLTLAAQEVLNIQTEAKRVRAELIDAFNHSEKYSLTIAGQMPAQNYNFRSTDSTMTYAEQWRHCIFFTCDQLAGRLGVKSPYEAKELAKLVKKEDILIAIKNMYSFVKKTIQEVPADKLFEKTPFTDGEIPYWRLFYVMENHLIHHRGQCIVYLRLKGIVPEGYVGW